jgi:hypothetical protein
MSTQSFISFDYSYLTLWLFDLALPALLKQVNNVEDVVIQEADKKMLKSLKDERVVYVSNHPSTKEPPVTFIVANHTYSRFHYMAGREVFDWYNGFLGQLIKRIGGYSVLAGTSDRESLKMTRAILAEKAGKLALFPEGEPTGNENDTLLPFQPGSVQLAIWGYEDALKKDKSADVVFVTAFVKYRMNGSTEAIRQDVDSSITKMESVFSLDKAGKTLPERLLAVATAVVDRSEKSHGIYSASTWDFDYRVGNLRHHILDTVAVRLDIKKWDYSLNAIEKLRRLLTTFEAVSVGLPDPKKELPSPKEARWGREYLQPVYDLISLKKNYILSLPSPERIYEWIYRLEHEIFGKTLPRPCSAYLSFAPIYRVSDFYNDYKENKKEVLEKMTLKQREDVQALLDAEVQKSFPLFPPDYTF